MSRPEIRVVPIDALSPDPLNPRFDLGDISMLTEDIKAVGIQTPLEVRPGSVGRPVGACVDCGQEIRRAPSGVLEEHGDPIPCPGGSLPAGDEWWILDGHRRHAAARDAGLREVPVIVKADVRTPADVLLYMVRSAHHRRNLTALEEARAFEQLELFGLTETRIAQQTRQPIGHVKARRRLLTLPEASQADLQAGRMTLDDALALLDLPPERADDALRSVGTKTFRQEVARHELAMVSSEPTPAQIAERLRDDFLAPYLDGSVRPAETPALKTAWVEAMALGLPSRTAKRWAQMLGLTEPVEIARVPFTRALTALAVVISDERSIYDLLAALGYEQSPVEVEWLEGA